MIPIEDIINIMDPSMANRDDDTQGLTKHEHFPGYEGQATEIRRLQRENKAQAAEIKELMIEVRMGRLFSGTIVIAIVLAAILGVIHLSKGG